MTPTSTVRAPWRALLLLVVASRLALEVVGLTALEVLPKASTLPRRNLVYHEPVAPALEIWSRWDAEWYLLIADRGYDVRGWFAATGAAHDHLGTAGFLPLFPMAIRALAPLLGEVGAGVALANAALLASVLLLFRLVFAEAGGGELGERAGLAACALLLLHPMSLFLSAVYAESLFLALSLAALVAVRSQRPLLAAAAAAAAALTRPFGVILAVPLAIEWWEQRRASPHGATARWGLLAAAAPGAGLAAFLAFSARTFGDPFAFFARQARWRGATGGPWQAFVRWWQEGPSLHGSHESSLELAIALASLALLPLAVRTLRRSSWAYAVVAVLLPLGSTLWSFGRFSLTVFPLFAAGGIAVARGARVLPVLYAFLGVALGALLMALFATWWWAG